jgi:hypothetical protein
MPTSPVALPSAAMPTPRFARSAPLGAAPYDADVKGRARRAASELVGAIPELEAHEDAVAAMLQRALSEQDRASRADEVLRRFSPSVRKYIERQSHMAR